MGEHFAPRRGVAVPVTDPRRAQLRAAVLGLKPSYPAWPFPNLYGVVVNKLLRSQPCLVLSGTEQSDHLNDAALECEDMAVVINR
jgi:hypothetical protein